MALHRIPTADVIAHTAERGCVCGPSEQPVIRPDGTIRYVIVHHPLDGRPVADEIPDQQGRDA